MTDHAVPVTGGCLCGAVRYQAEAFLQSAYYCHCSMCQKTSGGTFEIGVPLKAGSLKFMGTSPVFYASSEIGERGSCGTCGSRLLWRPRDPGSEYWTNVSVSSLDQPGDAQPQLHIYVDSKYGWFDVADDLPRYSAEDSEAALIEVANSLAN